MLSFSGSSSRDSRATEPTGPPCVVCAGVARSSAWPDLSPGCHGAGSQPRGAVPMEQKEPFPADNPWLQQGPFGAGVGRFGSFSAIPAVFSCSPMGRVGGSRASAALEPWAHQWPLSPAHSTCNNMFVTGARQAESHWQPLQSLPLSGGKRPLHTICILLSQHREIKPCFLSVNIGRPSSSLPEGKQ